MAFNKLLSFFNKKILARIRNKIIQRFTSEDNLLIERKKREDKRVAENRPHLIYYFHQVDDPYSILILPLIENLKNKYNIELEYILVGEPPNETIHEPSMYEMYCLNDVRNLAPWYGIDNKINSYPPNNDILNSNKILASCEGKEFINKAINISNSIWLKDYKNTTNSSEDIIVSDDEIKSILEEGNQKRIKIGYYFGSAFHYEGENYWGVDRLDHLEDRLTELGLKNNDSNKYIATRKDIEPTQRNEKKKLTLNFFPSLNSPYTYISFPRVRGLASAHSIDIVTKPVLPMLMRGMNIPRYKVKYILSDAAREGRKHGININDVYSPLGEPAEMAYSLFPAIDNLGKGFDYIESLTKASFHDGINIGSKDFLRKLIEELDLPWNDIREDLGSDLWKSILKENLDDMYSGNCWGVPSFNLTDENGENPFYQWGQDRIWLIEKEIIRRLH